MSSHEPNIEEFQALTEVGEQRKVIEKLTGDLRRSRQRSQDLTESARLGAYDAVVALGRPPKVPKAKTRVGDDRKPEAAVLHLSDWQLGKQTPTFDSDIAVQRVSEVIDKLDIHIGLKRQARPVDEAHLLLGGDFVEGVTVFPGQQWEIDSTLFEQHVKAARAATEAIRRTASIVDIVHVWEEDGNHGRIGRRGDVPKGDNSDRFTYYNVRIQVQDLEEEGRVVWHPTKGWYSIIEVGRYRALLVHGDEVKGFGGQTPAFGIAKKVTAWASGVIEPFTDCYMGHWHQPLVIPLPVGNRRVFVNPSLESDAIYAQEFVGANGYPGQRLNFVDPVKGRVTSEHVLWLD